MINIYEVVIGNQYYMGDLVEDIVLDDNLDEISYKASIRILAAPKMPALAPAQAIRVSGLPYEGKAMKTLLHPGIIWEVESQNKGTKHIDLIVYDSTIYLAKSEDERLMAAGQTASQRLQAYAKAWGIPVAPGLANTRIALARDVKRTKSIYNMIKEDLIETVDKGGDMYRPRMTSSGIELYKIGSNSVVWELEQIEDQSQRRTLEGTVTQVKVLGQEPKKAPAKRRKKGDPPRPKDPDMPFPILAVEKGQTSKLGTLQKVIQDSSITSVAQAKKAATKILSGIQETYTVTGPDVNTIRAGDKVKYNGMDLIVTSVKHRLGYPGSMDLTLAGLDKVRRDYYARSF